MRRHKLKEQEHKDFADRLVSEIEELKYILKLLGSVKKKLTKMP